MFKIAWKYIKGYKKHTVVCITGIAFSVMLIFSLVGISSRIISQYQDLLLNASSIHDVKINKINYQMMEDIYNDILPEDCKKLINQWCGTIYTEKENVNTMLIAVEGQWQTFYKTELKEGHLPQKEYEICVEERFCNKYGLKLSDTLDYEIYDDAGKGYKVTFTVTGIIGNMPSASMTQYIFTDYSTSLELRNQQEFFVEDTNNSVLVMYNKYTYEEEKITDLYVQLAKRYGPRFISEHVEENEEKNEIFNEKGTYTSVGNSFYVICAMVFICMTVFIYNAISISMTEKIRQYGILRCVGMEHSQLTKIILIEQFFNTVVGVIVGIVGGKLLNYVVANKVIECFVPVSDADLAENVWAYIITVAVAVLAVLIAFAGMMMKMSKRKPLELLRFMEEVKEVKVKNRSNNIVKEMARRNIKRTPSKSRILTLTIFIATLLIVMIGNVITSINFDINKTPSGIAQVEVFSSLASEEAPYIDAEVIECIKQEEAVKNVYWQRIEYGYDILVNGEVSDKISGVLIYSDNLMETFLEFNDVKGIDVSNDIAIVLTEESKDCVTEIVLKADTDIDAFPNARKEYALSVNACVAVSGKTLIGSGIATKSCVIINERLANKMFGEVKDCTNVYLEVKGNTDSFAVRDMVGIDAYTYVDLDDIKTQSHNQMIGMIIMALYMLVATVILNIFVISNMIKSNISLRAKEIGMLRSIGAEKGCIEKTISNEILLLTQKGLLSACVVTLPVSMYIYSIINETVGIGYGGYLVGIPVILLSAYLISKIAIKTCLKSEITEMVRNE